MKRYIGMWLMMVLSLLSLSGAEGRPDMVGQVNGPKGPLAKATVFIYTAGPKTGSASLCPSCYADCRKRAKTDAEGRFKIAALDPELLFRILVVASDHEATFVTKIDPASGPVAVTMKAVNDDPAERALRIAGVVIGPDGHAVTGAVLEVNGVSYGEGSRWGGTDSYTDPLTVSDDQGRFVLKCKKGEVTGVHVIAEARGLAKRWVELKPGRDHLVRLEEGVAITGRVLHQGKPLKDVALGMVTTVRRSGTCLHDFETVTDADGRFGLYNLPPKTQFYFYSKIDSLSGKGAVPIREVTTKGTETKIDLGDLNVGPAHRIAGRVVLSDGKAVPAETRLLLSRGDAWDHTEVTLGTDGTFEVPSVLAGPVGVHVRIDGYKFAKENPSLDWMNGSIIGQVTKDIPDLKLVMTPGKWQYNGVEEKDMPAGADRYPQDKPLRGAGGK